MKSFLDNFYRHSATFYWSHCGPRTTIQLLLFRLSTIWIASVFLALALSFLKSLFCLSIFRWIQVFHLLEHLFLKNRRRRPLLQSNFKQTYFWIEPRLSFLPNKLIFETFQQLQTFKHGHSVIPMPKERFEAQMLSHLGSIKSIYYSAQHLLC